MSQLDGNPAQEEQTTEQQATPVEQSVSNDDQGNDVEAVLKEIVAPDGRQKYERAREGRDARGTETGQSGGNA